MTPSNPSAPDTSGQASAETKAEHTPGTDAVHLPDRSEEARNLATEGLEEKQHGNKEEGDFLIEEARNLDKAAADEVVGKKR